VRAPRRRQQREIERQMNPAQIGAVIEPLERQVDFADQQRSGYSSVTRRISAMTPAISGRSVV
jgi:hypothetical protein